MSSKLCQSGLDVERDSGGNTSIMFFDTKRSRADLFKG